MHAGYLWPFQMIADDDLQRNFNDLVVEGVSLSNRAKFSNFGAEKKAQVRARIERYMLERQLEM